MTLPEIEKLILWALTTLGSAFLGSYLGAYLKKKGENLATHEDIDKLVEQVSAVTTTTKMIEAKISDDVWRRQKHWELKRDVLFELMRKLRATNDALLHLRTVFAKALQNQAPQNQAEASRKWLAAIGEFEEATLLLDAVCGRELSATCNDLTHHFLQLSKEITQFDQEKFDESQSKIFRLTWEVKNAIRKEFDLPA